MSSVMSHIKTSTDFSTHLSHSPEPAVTTFRLFRSDVSCMCVLTSLRAVPQCDVLSPLRCHSAPTCF